MKIRSSHFVFFYTLAVLHAVISLIINFVTSPPAWLLPYKWYPLGVLVLAITVGAYLQLRHKKLIEEESKQERLPKIYPPILEKKEIEDKLVDIRISLEELTRESNRATGFIKKRQFRIKQKRLEKERDALRKQLKHVTQHLLDFGCVTALELQHLLMLGGWDVEPGEIEPLNMNKAEFCIRQKHGPLKSNRVLVHYVPRAAGINDIEDIERALEKKNISRGWLIAARRYDEKNIENLNVAFGREDKNRKITFFEPHEFYFNELFNLEGYFNWLTENGRALKIGQFNVSIDGIRPTFNNQGKETESQHIGSVEDDITYWLNSDGENQMAILGDFGTGKTWFCWQYALGQLKEYLRKPGKERIPILIPLRDYIGRAEPELLIEKFCDNYQINFINYDLFNALNSEGKFLIILDGLDEMVTGANDSDLKDTFEKLGRLAVPNSKIILTSRRTLFKSSDERRILIGTHDTNTQRTENPESPPFPNFEVIRLDKFDTKRIRKFIRNRYPKDWKRYWEMIAGSGASNLLELARRPIMLEIILEVFEDDINLDTQITIVDLYKKYTDRWLKRVRRTAVVSDESDPRRQMQVLAWKIYESGELKIEHSKLPELLESSIREIFDLTIYESGVKEASDYVATPPPSETDVTSQTSDIRTKSFLERNAAGEYFFAHKSFLEYFVAQKLCRDINLGKREAFEKYHLSHEIIEFLRHMEFDSEILFQWIEDSRGEQFEPLHANLLTLLNKKNLDLTGRDFSGLFIVGAKDFNVDLCGANLEGCRFTGATLRKVDLGGSTLRNTDFTDAKLYDLNLGVRSPAKGVAFSPSGKFIVSGRDDSSVIVFGKEKDRWIEKEVLQGHTDSVTNVAINSSGSMLASSSFDRTVRLWKLNSERKFVKFLMPAHGDTVYDIEFATSNNGNPAKKIDYIFTASGNSIKVWRIREAKPGEIVSDEVTTITQHKDKVYKLAVSPNGDYLASAGFDCRVGLWKIEHLEHKINLELVDFLEGHKEQVNGVAFSPDGLTLASSSNDTNILIWSLKNKKVVKHLPDHTAIVWDVAYSPTGNYLASGSLDKTVKVWDVHSRDVVSLEEHSATVWCVRFSPINERLVASGSFDNTIKIWDWKQGRCLETLPMGKSANQNFDCTGMKLFNVKGLSTFQEIFLMDQGAIKQ